MIGALHASLLVATMAFGEDLAVLKSVRPDLVADTIRLDLEFAGTRPRRERIGRPDGAGAGRQIRIEFEGARLDSALDRKWPRWLHAHSDEASDILSLRIDLTEATPWRAVWAGDTMRVSILNRVDTHPPWKNPWVLGAAGVAMVGGGVALWMQFGSEASPSPPAASDVIPPPDIAMPE